MPTYTYKNPETGETQDVIQTMSEDHVFVSNGVEWKRVFQPPQTSIDTKWDAMSPTDFVEKSRNKKGTYGDILDKASELSDVRKKSMGVDPRKEKVMRKYEKETKKRHPFRERKKDVKINFANGKVS